MLPEFSAEELQAWTRIIGQFVKRSDRFSEVLEVEELGRSAKAAVAAVADFVVGIQYTAVVAAVPENSAADFEEESPCIAAVREHC